MTYNIIFQVWRKFQKIGIKPERLDFNLLLRAVNECGVGETGLSPELLHAADNMEIQTNKKTRKLLSRLQRKQIGEFKQIDSAIAKYECTDEILGTNTKETHDNTIELAVIEDVGNNDNWTDLVLDSSHSESIDGDVMPINLSNDLSDNKEWWELDIFSETDPPKSTGVVEVRPQLPNVLELDEDLSTVVSIDRMKRNDDRFALLGGLDAFLKTLEKNNVTGDIVTFTQLLKSVPKHQENEVIIAMKVAGVKADTDFYNHLIYRRSKFYKDEAFVSNVKA